MIEPLSTERRIEVILYGNRADVILLLPHPIKRYTIRGKSFTKRAYALAEKMSWSYGVYWYRFDNKGKMRKKIDPERPAVLL